VRGLLVTLCPPGARRASTSGRRPGNRWRRDCGDRTSGGRPARKAGRRAVQPQAREPALEAVSYAGPTRPGVSPRSSHRDEHAEAGRRLALVFWAWLLGPLGALLAIPLSVQVKALLVDVDPAGRWRKLSPAIRRRSRGPRANRVGAARPGRASVPLPLPLLSQPPRRWARDAARAPNMLIRS
jgi:hypothetical protein